MATREVIEQSPITVTLTRAWWIGITGAVLAAALDVGQLFVHTAREGGLISADVWGALAAQALAVGLGVSVAALLLVLLYGLLCGCSLPPFLGRHGLAAAALGAAAAIPVLWFCGRLASGAWVSQQALISGLIRYGLPVAILAVLVLIAVLIPRFLERSRVSGLIAFALISAVAAATFHWVDGNLYRTGNYDFIHDALSLMTLGCATLAAASLLARWNPRPGKALALSVLCLLGGLALVYFAAPKGQVRMALDRTTVRASRVERYVARLRPQKPIQVFDLEEHLAAIAAHRAYADEVATGPEMTPHVSSDTWSVLWITVDTVRADHISAYGYERPTSPRLDELARGGALFENAWSQNNLTAFSMQSMFFGVYPPSTPYARARHGEFTRDESVRSLAQQLTDAGYSTCSIPALPGQALRYPEYVAMIDGFEQVNPGAKGTHGLNAPEQNRRALTFLENLEDTEQFFLWLHYMDPHAPYEFHERESFGTGSVDRYDGEIRRADHHLGIILDRLEQLGRRDRTIVVVNSDHGEALGDHASDHHGSTLFEEQIHVPLVILVPGLPAHRVVTPVENVDVMPTLLDFLNLKKPAHLEGESLADLLLHGDPVGETPRLPVALSFQMLEELSNLNGSNIEAIRLGHHKLVVPAERSRIQLHDLEEDPRELTEFSDRLPKERDQLMGLLEAFRTTFRSVTAEAASAEPPQKYTKLLATEKAPSTRSTITGIAAQYGSPEGEGIIRTEWETHGLKSQMLGLLARYGTFLESDDHESILRHSLTEAVPFGVCCRALETLLALDRERQRQILSDRGDDLARNLSAPFPIAVRAAELLANLGDDRGAGVLKGALQSDDYRARWRSACALGDLGDNVGLAELVREFPVMEFEPELASMGLKVLSRFGVKDVLPHVISMLGNPYMNETLRRGALNYLKDVGGEQVEPGLLLSMGAWNPELAAEAGKLYRSLFGGERHAGAKHRSRSLRSALELLDQNQWTAAAEQLSAMASSSVTVTWLEHLSVSAWTGARQEGEARVFRERVLGESGARPWHEAARLGADRAPKPRRLEVLSFQILGCPQSTDRMVTARLHLRNSGQSFLHGGRHPAAPRLGLVQVDGNGQAEPVAGLAKTLPSTGLKPGESCVVGLRFRLPEPNRVVELRVSGSGTSGLFASAPLLVDGERTMAFQPVHEDAKPRAVPIIYKGRALAERWLTRHITQEWAVDPEGAAYFSFDHQGAQLLSEPILLPPTGLLVSLRFEILMPPALADTPVFSSLYWSYGKKGEFSGKQAHRGSLPPNQVHTLEARVPGTGKPDVTRFRLDLGHHSGLVRIDSIQVRPGS